jgi:hypothetical protein
MAENTPKLAYLLDPLFQIENVNGKPLVGGYIEVYYAGTNEKYITYQNFDFTQNPFKIPLGSDGRAVVLAQTEQAYDVYVRDSFGNLVFSRLNIAPGGAGGVAFGMTKVNHDDTLTGNGTQLSPLGVSPLTNLAVDETMTAYEATVEGKESLVLGVNGDWFSSAISGISNDFVTNETFSACCSAVKGGLDNKVDLSALDNYYTKIETWNTFLPRSGLDLSNYYTTAQTYNKYEIEDRLDGKQDRLTFGYDENSAISSINNSALAGGQGGDTTPWISGAKILADTQTFTDNMIIQVLSSFTLSGNKNHCIAVKGGVYRFPNRWEIASGISETNYFMPQSSMSGYLPTSSFTSYTASIANNLESNWNYTNSAYSLSINNFYNKLDASAFSAYTADAGETYTLVGGDNISISSDDEEKTTTISVTGEVGDTTPWISGAKILAETKYMEPGEYIQALSSFTLSGNKNHCIAVKGGGYYFPTNPMLASGISSYLTGEFVPSSTFSSFVSSWSDHLSTLYSNDSYLSSCVSNISANKLDASSYHELTAGDNIDIQNYVISGKDWTNEIKDASANAFNEATAANPTSSTQWNSCYETVNTNSGEWQKVSAKLDTTAFESYTANDETYLLKGGYNIGVSSDDINKETTIYYTGTNGDEQVNQVVRQFSANGTWLTSHQDWTDTITAASSYAYNQATAQIPAPFDPTYISGQIDNKLNKSESANYYPMTGNPSGFLTTETDWTNVITAASSYAYNQATAHEPDMSLYVPMSAVSALIDIVQTYSGKWLLNGDL